MPTQVGAGFSENSASKKAGLEVATAAVAELGGKACDLAIMYSTSKHDRPSCAMECAGSSHPERD
jgi:hypothetical protein